MKKCVQGDIEIHDDMVPGHPFMTACIEKFSKTFDGSYASGGPRLFQYVSKVMCKVNRYEN